MPLYTFQCIKCNNTQELIMSFGASEEAQPRCEQCFGGYLTKRTGSVSKGGVVVRDGDLMSARSHNGKKW